MAKLKTIKVMYETEGGTNWTAYIVAFSGNEAIYYTKRLLGKNFKNVSEVSELSRIDALSDEARDFLKPHLTNQGEPQLICPWCKKKFDNSHGLKIHISKQHGTKDVEEKDGTQESS